MTEDALSPEEVDALLADTQNEGEEEESETKTDLSMPDESSPDKTEKKSKKSEEEKENTSFSQQQHNIKLLLDIYMQVTVELGRTKKKVKEILGWGDGSIIELDKPSTEPVNLLVNKRLVARGEVIVIDENFGVRITEIVDPRERLLSLTR